MRILAFKRVISSKLRITNRAIDRLRNAKRVQPPIEFGVNGAARKIVTKVKNHRGWC